MKKGIEMIRNVKIEDLKELAPIYKEIYDDVDIQY